MCVCVWVFLAWIKLTAAGEHCTDYKVPPERRCVIITPRSFPSCFDAYSKQSKTLQMHLLPTISQKLPQSRVLVSAVNHSAKLLRAVPLHACLRVWMWTVQPRYRISLVRRRTKDAEANIVKQHFTRLLRLNSQQD